MKKVLITGATGFVGTHLTDYLSSKNEFEIYGTSLTEEKNPSEKIKIEAIDLTGFESVKILVEKVKPDIVYHLAALTSPAESFNNPTPVVLGNIEIQMNLLNAVRNAGLSPRILIVSSADIYGLVDPKNLPLNESAPLRPVSPYAVSKAAQDLLGLQYSLSYKMDIVRVRPFNHTGPGQPPGFVIPSFAKQIAEIEKGSKEPVLKVGDLSAKRDFTDVRDVIKAYVSLMDNGQIGEVYNIGSGKSYEIRNLLDMLLSFSDKKIEVGQDPDKLRPINIPDAYCDYTKLENLAGWKPEIPIEQTLKDTLEYWRSVV